MTKIKNGKMRVVVQSPYDANDREERMENIKYARAACRDATNRGENPMASHLYYPQFLDNGVPEERAESIRFGYDWWPLCHKVIFYIDRGMSHGMLLAMQKAVQENKHLEMRRILGGQAEVVVPPIPEEQHTQSEHQQQEEQQTAEQTSTLADALEKAMNSGNGHPALPPPPPLPPRPSQPRYVDAPLPEDQQNGDIRPANPNDRWPA